MSTLNQPPNLDTKDRDELIDFSIRLGQTCWDVYCHSKIGFIRVFMLPSDTARRRANELFHLGFSARMLMCPPLGIPALDSVLETPQGEAAWDSYLDSMDGKIVLDGAAYPETPEVVLRWARKFFLAGFSAGTLAVIEILNS